MASSSIPRTRNRYPDDPQKSYRLSRSRLENFLQCPRCFYLDRKLGIDRPQGPPFNLNIAVDSMMKKEFDHYRILHMPHPLFKVHGIDAIPFEHPDLEIWRDSLRQGIKAPIPHTNIILTGGVDDVWVDRKSKKLMIVDYKATSKNAEVSIDADWQITYKRQAEIYQYLFRSNGFEVLDTAYFVYCNALTTADRFDAKLDFKISFIPYKGRADWVESAVQEAQACLQSKAIPPPTATCEYCKYTAALTALNLNT